MSINNMVSLDKFKANPNKFIKDLYKRGTPLVLAQNDEAVAVLQDMDDYRKLIDAVYMLKLLAQGEKEIRNSEGQNQSEVFDELNKILESPVE